MITTLIGVCGALAGGIVGSLITQLLQRRNAALDRLHEVRIDAYRNYAIAIMEFRKALMDRWFIENEGRPHLTGHAVYETRNAAWSAYFQVALVAGDRAIVARAEEARDLASALKNAADRAELNSQAEACRSAVGRFAELARHEVAPH
ncbi:hypothetical protein PV396_41380 [Streptomyces sp. ME02-8801-2C]|uniref:hypothetical protein n=1 Tax=Streptomyces sp. ME02-8801-2C TaxID=3028680 RepID=UPI0029A90D15|nr:hypothetical protein [Streptomyces sp. ME02-8801-2C]MDX3458319.1 hypothetical protein [Streptomyces sp. ME02-8801-2C]